MKTALPFLVLYLLLSLIMQSSCWAYERLMIEEPHQTLVFQGNFKETPWYLFPGEALFSFEMQSPQSSPHEKYYFAGSTGEDSFEIRHTWAKFGGFRAGRPDQDILKVPFKVDSDYPLPLSILSFPNCTKKDLAVLKMLSLKDNRLGYRIILPGCLKEALKKEQEKEKQP